MILSFKTPKYILVRTYLLPFCVSRTYVVPGRQRNSRPNSSFHLYSISQAHPYTDGSHQTVSGSGLLLWLSHSTAKGIDPFLCYVKPSVRISTLKGTMTFTYPMTSIVTRTCNTSSLPSQNFSGRCRTYFSCAKVVQAVYGKYLYALSRITRRYSVT